MTGTDERQDRAFPGYLLGGRIRTSTIALVLAFLAVWWLHSTYQPAPEPPPQVPAFDVVPPGFIPDPAYTWAPRTDVMVNPTTEPTTTTTPTTTPTTPTTPTSPTTEPTTSGAPTTTGSPTSSGTPAAPSSAPTEPQPTAPSSSAAPDEPAAGTPSPSPTPETGAAGPSTPIPAPALPSTPAASPQ